MITQIYLHNSCDREFMEACSNFVTNSYGESCDSSCEKIMSPCPEQVSPQLKSKQGVLKRK